MRRRRGGAWPWLAVAGAALLAALAWAAYDRFGLELRQAAGVNAAARRPREPFAPAAKSAPPIRPGPGATLPDIIAFVKHGIVKIETYDELATTSGLGSGFVIDARGLVATNYHVVEDAVKADVLFNDGTRYGVEGYAAVAPELDLAILKLNGAPPNVQALELEAGDPPRDASQVYAIGHPHNHEFNTTGGIVGRVLRTSQLPEETRSFLQTFMGDAGDPLWIQHDARIAEGNSGGPLLGPSGAVVGINTWVNPDIGLSYALGVGHLRELAKKPMPKVASLRELRRASGPGAGSRRLLTMTSARLRALEQTCAARQWRAANAQQYAELMELAQAVTGAKYLEQHDAGAQISGPERIALSEAADAVIAALSTVSWKLDDHVHPLNALAPVDKLAALDGLFAFGTIERVIDGAAGDVGVVVKLVDRDARFFVRLEQRPPALAAADGVLVLGLLLPAEFRARDEDEAMPVVLSTDLLPVSWQSP